MITFPSPQEMVERFLSLAVAKEYRFEAGSHIRYQLPVSVSARRTLFQALVRTRQPHCAIATMRSRGRDEHITLQVRPPHTHGDTRARDTSEKWKQSKNLLLSIDTLEFALWVDASDPLIEILIAQLCDPLDFDASCREMQALHRIG